MQSTICTRDNDRPSLFSSNGRRIPTSWRDGKRRMSNERTDVVHQLQLQVALQQPFLPRLRVKSGAGTGD